MRSTVFFVLFVAASVTPVHADCDRTTLSAHIDGLSYEIEQVFFPAPEWEGQDDLGWKVYVKTSPCSGRFDWVTVSKVNPTGRGGSAIWQNADLIIDGTGMRCVNETSSVCTKAAADAEAVIVRGQSKFRDYCCKEYTVWQHSQTKKWTIVLGQSGNPGLGWEFEDGPMCCDEAEEITGLTGACSGIGNNRPSGGRFIGCFKDTPKFDLAGFLLRSRTNTPQACIALCRDKGFAFAGVQYSESCVCGNSYGKYGPASNCNMKCTGDSGQNCGGYNANAIYSTGVDGSTPNINNVGPVPRNTPGQPGGPVPRNTPRNPGGANDDWAGTYGDGASTVTISGGGGSISASFRYQNGSASGNGQWTNCRVNGNTAECSWTANHDDDTKSGTRRGTLKITLSGNTISGAYYEDEPQWTYKGGRNPSNVSSSMRKGAVWPFTYPRR